MRYYLCLQVLLFCWTCLDTANSLLPRRRRFMRLRDYGTCFKQFRELSSTRHPDIGIRIDKIITKYGYPVEEVKLETEDGYILTLYRIPYSPSSPLDSGKRKTPVILNHGLGSNGQSFLIQHKERNLAMLLASSGFDVFIANCRGSKYSQGHVNPDLTPKKRQYWNFSFHEIGVYDVPAIIEKVSQVTGQERMYYVGHSMGTTALVVAGAERPEINSRIITAFFLGPAVYITHATATVGRLAPFSKYLQFLLNSLLGGKIDTAQRTERITGRSFGHACASPLAACGICANYLFNEFGYDAEQMNYTTLGPLFDTFPDSGSSKALVHYLQVMRTAKFCQFDYGFRHLNKRHYDGIAHPPCYNLHAYTVPSVLFYADSDNLDTPQDVKRTASSLGFGATKELHLVEWMPFNHVDFVSAIDADELIYKRILHTMTNDTYNTIKR